MPQPTKIFRVFVSSTFTDMKDERRLLQKHVFPRLERFCEQNGAKFQAVDLRWGISEESSLNQKTLDICLNEIRRCQRLSPKPNFLILLGDKYGWQPIPTKIPEEEMVKILDEITDDKKNLLSSWYKIDTNAIPPEYLLQRRKDDFKDHSNWKVVEKDIQQTLRNAVKNLSFSKKQLIKYFTSATHQEIIEGALHDNDDLEKPEEHVFALVRETKNLPMDQSANGYIDLIDQKPDPYSQEQLIQLKKELKDKLGENKNYISYPAHWELGNMTIEKTDEFIKQVYKLLKKVIEEQMKAVISPDEIDHEVNLHREFKERLTEHFCGREKILRSIKDYHLDSHENKVLAMIGDSGSGKSSVMAKAVEVAESEDPNRIIVYRFIGVTSGSSNIISLLQNVSGQIAREYNTTIEELAGEGNEKNLHDINGISEVFRKAVKLGIEDKPLLIFFDALDQLNDTDNARALYWLPNELSENTRIVVSSLPELDGQLKQQINIKLPVLPLKDAKEILYRWLSTKDRRLTIEQEKEVLGKFEYTGSAIFLKMAYEMVRHWTSYHSNLDLAKDVKGIINNFIDSLHADHDKEFVQDVICLMLCGRYQGLAENEILEIFAFDDDLWKKFLDTTHKEHRQELIDIREEFKEGKLKGNMKIPIVVWSRLFLDLEPFLTERDADGVPIIAFFHRQFNEVLGDRYDLVEAN